MLAVLRFRLDRTESTACGSGSQQTGSQELSGIRMLVWDNHDRRATFVQGVAARPTVPGSLRRTCASAARADSSSTMSRSK